MAQIQPVRRQSFSNSYALFDTAKPSGPGKVAAANLVVEEPFDDDDDDDEDAPEPAPLKTQEQQPAQLKDAKAQPLPQAGVAKAKAKAPAPAESPEARTSQLGTSPTDSKQGWWFQDVRE